MNGIVLSTLRELASSGAVRGYTLHGQVGGYTLEIRYGMSHQVLIGKRGDVRLFAKIETAFDLLRTFNVASVEVIIAGHEIKARPYRKGRPEALKTLAAIKKSSRMKILPSEKAQMKLPGVVTKRSRNSATPKP